MSLPQSKNRSADALRNLPRTRLRECDVRFVLEELRSRGGFYGHRKLGRVLRFRKHARKGKIPVCLGVLEPPRMKRFARSLNSMPNPGKNFVSVIFPCAAYAVRHAVQGVRQI